MQYGKTVLPGFYHEIPGSAEPVPWHDSRVPSTAVERSAHYREQLDIRAERMAVLAAMKRAGKAEDRRLWNEKRKVSPAGSAMKMGQLTIAERFQFAIDSGEFEVGQILTGLQLTAAGFSMRGIDQVQYALSADRSPYRLRDTGEFSGNRARYKIHQVAIRRAAEE